MQVMMKLIGSHAIDYQGLDRTARVHSPFAPRVGGTETPEPTRVQVRIRQHADPLPDLRWARPSRPNRGRLPVGLLLDCYV